MPSSPDSPTETSIEKDLTREDRVATTDKTVNSTIEELKSKLNAKDLDCVTTGGAMIPENQKTHQSAPSLNEDGLIVPRKPPNPVKDNSERQNLHKEMLFNQKIGKNVLNQKSELQRALEKQKEHLAKKEMESHVAAKAPELEKVIADRAKRLQANSEDKNEDDKVINKELLQVRMKLKNRKDSK